MERSAHFFALSACAALFLALIHVAVLPSASASDGRAGQLVIVARCTVCHGDRGVSDDAAVPLFQFTT